MLWFRVICVKVRDKLQKTNSKVILKVLSLVGLGELSDPHPTNAEQKGTTQTAPLLAGQWKRIIFLPAVNSSVESL